MKKMLIPIFLLLAVRLFAQDNDPGGEISSYMLFLWCLIGCVLQEFLYWFELRHEIAKGNIPPALKSKTYWIITILAIALFSVASFLYFHYGENGSPNFFTTAVFAAGFSRLFKSAVATVQVPGTTDRKIFTRGFSFKDYLLR